MDVLFIEGKYKGEIKLSKKVLSYCKKFKTIGLYASIQFSDNLKNIIKELKKEKIKVVSSTPERTSGKYQILGCDLGFDNLKLNKKVDGFLYVGDGEFHANALVLGQKDENEFKEVMNYNPINKKFKSFKIKDVEKILKRYKGGLMKFLSSNNIGVLISIKPGQEQLKMSKKLEKYDKNFYYFLSNDIDFSKKEDFPFIEYWVNSACPRLGFENSVVNLTDALDAENILSRDSLLTR